MVLFNLNVPGQCSTMIFDSGVSSIIQRLFCVVWQISLLLSHCSRFTCIGVEIMVQYKYVEKKVKIHVYYKAHNILIFKH